MTQRTIFGRTADELDRYGLRGCGYIGKIVSYPAGRYEEIGEVYLDLALPHCILVLGKRGTGKSYTLGVLAESFGDMEPELSNRLSVLIIDTMSVFHSLKTPNTNQQELARLKDFKDLKPEGMGDRVRIFMPDLAVEKLHSEGHEVMFDQRLTLPLQEVETQDWLELFDIEITDPAGTLLSRVVRRLKEKGQPFGYEAVYGEIAGSRGDEQVKESLKETFQMIEALKIFDTEGTSFSDIVKGGRISILDISYLGRIGGLDVRTLIVSMIARHLMQERTLYTTLEMQAESGLIDEKVSKDITGEHPLVYMLIDEAHLFLPNKGRTLASQPLIDWIKLGRHPGLSLILATQEPSAIHESSIKQADLIIAHNVTAKPDIDALKLAKQSYTSGSQEFDRMVSSMEFKKGLAVVMDDKNRRQELMRVRPRKSLHTGIDASLIPQGHGRGGLVRR